MLTLLTLPTRRTCRACKYEFCWLCGGDYLGNYTFGDECTCAAVRAQREAERVAVLRGFATAAEAAAADAAAERAAAERNAAAQAAPVEAAAHVGAGVQGGGVAPPLPPPPPPPAPVALRRTVSGGEAPAQPGAVAARLAAAAV